VFVATLSDAQSELWCSPMLILINGWDMTLQKIAGTDRAWDASIRKVA
jgi:nitrogen fixation protein